MANAEEKAVLLSQAQADLKTFVSKDETRVSLTNIRVTKDFAEATNGHILVRVPHDGIDHAEWPKTGGTGTGLNGDSILLDPKVLEKAFKNAERKGHLPILSYVLLSLSPDGCPILTATDLKASANFKQKRVISEFPDTDRLIPEKEGPVAFVLSAKYLSDLADWAQKHGDGALYFYAGKNYQNIVRIEVSKYGAPYAIAAIAPMRPAYNDGTKTKSVVPPDSSGPEGDEIREEESWLKVILSAF